MISIQKKITKINYKAAENREISYVVIHYVGAVSTAEANCRYFENVNRKSSAHYFVDENSIWQCVEDKNIAWHVGADKYYNNCRNVNSIGIELCCKRNDKGFYFEAETIKNAQELTKELMAKYNVPIENVVRHYDVTRKVCPEPFVKDENAWLEFKNGLINSTKDLEIQSNDEEEDMVRYKTIDEVPDYAKETVKKLVEEGHIKGVSDDDLSLSDDMLRIFVAMDRARLFD